MRQVCVVCLVEKDISLFEWQSNRPAPRKKCKECRHKLRDREKENARHRAYQKERRKLFPDKVRESWERTNYGVCKSDFNYKECWVCGSGVRLCIDHCHTTGKARGLLCSNCNTALGYFGDDVIKMQKAIEYLTTLVDGPHVELNRKVYP